jgi:hypothetical protein
VSTGGRGDAGTRPIEDARVLESLLAAKSVANPVQSLPLDLDEAGQGELESLLARTLDRLHLIEDAARRRVAAGEGHGRLAVTVVIAQRPR